MPYADLGNLLTRGNRPRWMALGLILIAVSLVLCFIMNLVFPAPELEAHQVFGSSNSLRNTADRMLCKLSANASSSVLSNSSHSAKSLCTIDTDRRNWAFAAWVLIYSILGKLFFSYYMREVQQYRHYFCKKKVWVGPRFTSSALPTWMTAFLKKNLRSISVRKSVLSKTKT